MLEIIFQDIPQMLSEILAVGGLCGALFALILQRRHRGLIYWFCTWGVAGYLALVLIFLNGSKRYFVFLVLPAAMLTAYGLYQIRPLVRHIDKKYAGVAVFWFLLALLTIQPLYKLFRPDISRCYLTELASTIKNDAGGRADAVVVAGSNIARLGYYSGCREFPLLERWERQIGTAAGFSDFVRTLRFTPGVYYLCVQERSSHKFCTATELGLSESQWQLLAWRYTSRRKSRRMSVYRFEPSIQGAQLLRTEEDRKHFISLGARYLENGDFESIMTQAEAGEYADRLNLGKSKFFRTGIHEQPRSWQLIGPMQGEYDYEFEVSRNAPLSGAASLRLKTDHPMLFYSLQQFLGDRAGVLHFMVRGIPDSRFLVILLGRKKHGVSLVQREVGHFLLRDTNAYGYTLDLRPEDIAGLSSFQFGILLFRGEIHLDEVSYQGFHLKL